MDKFIRKHEEAILYSLIWSLGILIPVITTGTHSSHNPDIQFSWTRVFNSWLSLLPVFVAFLIHNIWMAPLLFRKGGGKWYCLALAVLVGAFVAFNVLVKPPLGTAGAGRRYKDRPRVERVELRDSVQVGPRPERPYGRPSGKPPGRRGNPWMPMSPVLMKLMLLIGVLGINLAMKAYMIARDREKMLAELQSRSLEQSLQYMKYQINPHFFMNTLNNIHALVDIDPEKAKLSILELSRLMRYTLYDGEKSLVPLSKDLDFVRNYVSLMKIRYADAVKVTLSTPSDVSGIEVPPLVFATFVENAFKHGISYEEDSFVDISVTASPGEILFTCRNRSHPQPSSGGGLGLSNIRGRLDIIYGSSYHLDISEDGGVYSVWLKLPFKTKISEQ